MMLSLPKLVGLCVVLWIVWRVFRAIDARKANIASKNDQMDNGTGNGNETQQRSSIDLEECTICKAWVARENCGRDDCPYQS